MKSVVSSFCFFESSIQFFTGLLQVMFHKDGAASLEPRRWVCDCDLPGIIKFFIIPFSKKLHCIYWVRLVTRKIVGGRWGTTKINLPPTAFWHLKNQSSKYYQEAGVGGRFRLDTERARQACEFKCASLLYFIWASARLLIILTELIYKLEC